LRFAHPFCLDASWVGGTLHERFGTETRFALPARIVALCEPHFDLRAISTRTVRTNRNRLSCGKFAAATDLWLEEIVCLGRSLSLPHEGLELSSTPPLDHGRNKAGMKAIRYRLIPECVVIERSEAIMSAPYMCRCSLADSRAPHSEQ